MREDGGNCLKYLKSVGTEKRGGETNILKREGQAWSRVGSPKKGGWNPLTNYVVTANKHFYIYFLFLDNSWLLLIVLAIADTSMMVLVNTSVLILEYQMHHFVPVMRFNQLGIVANFSL